MENVSKALIMVGSILVGILVISFMVLFLRKAGSMNAEYDTQMSDNERAKFNSQFEIYARDDNTIFDVITAVNCAWDINKRNDKSNGVDIEIYSDLNYNTLKYKLSCKDIISQNYLFNTNNEPVYIYDLAKSDDTKDATNEIYGNVKKISEDGKDNIVYQYNFKVQANGIGYNKNTGKVNNVKFVIQENPNYK